MRDILFRAWHIPEQKLYYRGYQRLSYIILCDDGQGKNGGKGIPVRRASYQDCELLECTDLEDKNGRLIFEGDLIRIDFQGKILEGEAGAVPDMFRSRRLHPLQSLLEKFGLEKEKDLVFEVVGNRYEKIK